MARLVVRIAGSVQFFYFVHCMSDSVTLDLPIQRVAWYVATVALCDPLTCL